MALTKQVNGVKVEMSPEEEAQIRGRWKKHSERIESKQSEEALEERKRQELLSKMGITEEEARLLAK